jgi:PAS domain S-box-containing protein
MTDRVRAALAAVSSAAAEFAENTTRYDRLLATVARCGAQVMSATCAVSLLSGDGETITPVAIHDDDPAISTRAQSMLFSRPLNSTIYSTFTPLTTTLFQPNLELAALRPKISDAGHTFMRETGVHGMIAVVLRVRGESLGLVTVMRHRVDLPAFDELDREIFEHISSLAALAVANARLFREAKTVEAMRRSEARAQEATMFLDAIVENIPNMVFVKDADRLSFVRFNRAGEQLLGLTRDQLIGKSDNDFFPPEEAKFFIEKDRETLRRQTLVDIPEEPIQTSTGERWLHTKKVPILDADGTPRFLLGISEDITERKRDVAELRLAKERAETASRELEAFSYSVAHDLRAPLRAIAGFGGALLEDYAHKLDDVGKSYLERIKSSTYRMGNLIDALLKLSQVTRSGLQSQPIDLGELFRHSVAALQRSDPNRNIEIVIGGDLATTGDPALLSIVFDNLCSNAWKFTAKSPAPRIELGSEIQDGRRVLFVRDNGAGFDMRYVEKLFGVFQRLHTEREFPGTGIGLATVQRIIQRHRGRVWAHGEVGAGATFYFTLHES